MLASIHLAKTYICVEKFIINSFKQEHLEKFGIFLSSLYC